jgi:hypothetical protein
MGADRSPLQTRDFGGQPKRFLAWARTVSRPNMDVVPNVGLTPVAPALYTSHLQGSLLGVLEKWREWHLWLDRDDALLVQPYTFEDEGEELALGGWVGLPVQKIEKSLGTLRVWSRCSS